MRRLAAAVAVLVLSVFVVAGLWAAASTGQPQTPEEQARSVAATLRCPTCVGESAAASSAPLAQAMRETVADQLAAGRSPDEIRAWFAARYGPDVLLDPPREGPGWVLWTVPLVGAAVAAWLIVRRGSRWWVWTAPVLAAVALGLVAWQATTGGLSATTSAARVDADTVAVLEQAVEAEPGDVRLRVTLAGALEEDGSIAEAARQYQAASRLRPGDETLRYRTAFALARAGDQAGAVPILEDLLERVPDHPEALLLLGTIYRDAGERRGDELLRRFVEVAPDHPGVASVPDELADEGS